MPRSLTASERAQIEAARRKVEALQQRLDEALFERDRAMLDAFNHRAKVTEIAEAAGVGRQQVYAILDRLAKRKS